VLETPSKGLALSAFGRWVGRSKSPAVRKAPLLSKSRVRMARYLRALVGLNGVMSYLVAQRTREFDIRLALGASRLKIVKRVLRDGMWRVAIGATIGLAATAGLARVLAGLVYGVGTFDISSLLAVVMLVVVALAACGIPAVRATRVDPAIALRNE
jgi:putative ABC transport system permease protein